MLCFLCMCLELFREDAGMTEINVVLIYSLVTLSECRRCIVWSFISYGDCLRSWFVLDRLGSCDIISIAAEEL